MNGAYVYTDGILVSFEEEGPESCNCQMAQKKDKDGDVHMSLGLKANAPKKNCIVVEITPASKTSILITLACYSRTVMSG